MKPNQVRNRLTLPARNSPEASHARSSPATHGMRRKLSAGVLHAILPFLLALLGGQRASADEQRPYPPSPVFAGVRVDRDSLVTAAPGSDQFGATWAADDNIYVAWGDGGGFGGTNSLGRASLGVARIVGIPPQWKAVNVWGGVEPISPQPPTRGKTSSGVIAIDRAIYLYVVKQGVWTKNSLWRSDDFGMTWHNLGSLFDEPGGAFADPGIIQFGRGYAGARDDFVYGYDEHRWKDGLGLFRVDKGRLADRKAYEFFAGLTGQGQPRWTRDLAQGKRVFVDPRGTEWGVSCMFHPVFRRYLLAVRHDGDSGRWGLFDAPEPWGPWTTVAYGDDFPEWTYSPDPKGASRNRPAWIHSFPVKWVSADGREMWTISDRGDRFNLAKLILKLRGRR